MFINLGDYIITHRFKLIEILYKVSYYICPASYTYFLFWIFSNCCHSN